MAKEDMLILFERTLSSSDAMIRRICHAYSTPVASQEDLYQEVVLAIWLGLKTFQGRSSLLTWVYRVTINTCISYLRRVGSKTIYSLNKIPEITEQETETIYDKDDIEYLYFLINQLNPLDKAILLMWLDELSYKQISEVTGLTPNAVGVKLSRIRDILHKKVKKQNNQ